jgi:hypothetical protein
MNAISFDLFSRKMTQRQFYFSRRKKTGKPKKTEKLPVKPRQVFASE